MINVGIVGLGRIADVHFPGYENHKDARIYAVCDTNEDLARARKNEIKADKHYTNFDDMLSDANIDAIEILTPTMLHEEMVIKAAQAGKHIAVQKPMANDLKSADRMIAAAAKNSKIFKVSDNYVFYPPIVLAKKMIENGDIGDPTNIRMKLISGGSGGWDVPATSWEWRLKEARQGRGMQTFDHGHHLWATAWYLLGEMEMVSAWIDYADGVVDSPATIMWKYKNAVKYGMCEYQHAPGLTIPSKYYANDEWFEIGGTKGIIIINHCTGLLRPEHDLTLYRDGKWSHIDLKNSDWGDGFIGSTRNFIDAILGNEPALLSAGEGRETLKFALAIRKSSTLHRVVYLDEMDALIPSLYARYAKIKKAGKIPGAQGLLDRIGLSGSTEKYASQAEKLTEELPGRFNAKLAAGWKIKVGLDLSTAGGQNIQYYLTVDNNQISLVKGPFPDSADLVIATSAGTWAAILLKKKKLEMAFLQGKLQLKGRAEDGLKLKSLLNI